MHAIDRLRDGSQQLVRVVVAAHGDRDGPLRDAVMRRIVT